MRKESNFLLSDDALSAAVGGRAVGGEVEPCACCDRFSPRKSVVTPRRECWYCRYADFHLGEPVALEIGVCRYPLVQSK